MPSFIFKLFLIKFTFLHSISFAEDLDYFKARLLQFSSSNNLKEWILSPLIEEKKENKDIKINITLGPSRGFLDSYNNLNSGEFSKIVDRINKSFGQPVSGVIKAVKNRGQVR